MKKIIGIMMAAAVLAACETKPQRLEVDEPAYVSPEDFTDTNIEVSGIITEVGDHEVTLLTEAGDSCKFILTQAEENRKVFGGYNLNDHVIVVPGNGDFAEVLLNVSTLMGRWVYKNVAEEESGIHIKEGGVATSINNDTQNFHNWSMLGIRLLLTWNGDGSDGIAELVDSCDIRYLSQDTLTIVSQFMPNIETVYYRQGSQPQR